MNIKEAKKTVERALDLGLPLMLWGPPGVGKSALVAQLAQERKWTLLDLRLAQLDATDLRGIPVPEHASRTVLWYPPAFLPREGEGILFLDEIDKASTLVKNAALQLVLERRLGDYQLPTGWRILCAGNREEDGAFSSPLGTALANRMLHVEVEPDLEVWAAWASVNGVSGDIVSFLRFRPELLCKKTGEHAFPTPRSWAAASRLFPGPAEGAGPAPQNALPLIASAVGAGAAAELCGWLKTYRDIKVEEVLAGRIPELPAEDASFRYALTLAVTSHLTRKGLVAESVPHLAALLDALSPELRVLFFKTLPAPLMARLAAHPALKASASRLVMDYVGA